MGRLKISFLSTQILLLLLLFISARLISGIDDLPTILESLECGSEWVSMVDVLKRSTKDCEFAILQGHRKYQEDRVTCKLDIRIPLIGKKAKNEAKLDLFGVFDGHGGNEASEMAKQHLLDYFLVHVIAGAFQKASNLEKHHDSITDVERWGNERVG